MSLRRPGGNGLESVSNFAITSNIISTTCTTSTTTTFSTQSHFDPSAASESENSEHPADGSSNKQHAERKKIRRKKTLDRFPKLTVLSVTDTMVECQLETIKQKTITFKFDITDNDPQDVANKLVMTNLLPGNHAEVVINYIEDIIRQLQENPNVLPTVSTPGLDSRSQHHSQDGQARSPSVTRRHRDDNDTRQRDEEGDSAPGTPNKRVEPRESSPQVQTSPVHQSQLPQAVEQQQVLTTVPQVDPTQLSQQQGLTIQQTQQPDVDKEKSAEQVTTTLQAPAVNALQQPVSTQQAPQPPQTSDGMVGVQGTGGITPAPISASQPGSGGPTPPLHCTPENTYVADQPRLSQQNSLEKNDSITSNSNLSELARKLQQLQTTGGSVTPLTLPPTHTVPPFNAPISAPSHPSTPTTYSTPPTFNQELNMQLAGGGGSGSGVGGSISSGGGNGSIAGLTVSSLGVPVQEANVVTQPLGPQYTHRTTDIPPTEVIQQVACEVEGKEGMRSLPLPHGPLHMHPGGALTIVVTPPLPPLNQALQSEFQGVPIMGTEEQGVIMPPAVTSAVDVAPLVAESVLPASQMTTETTVPLSREPLPIAIGEMTLPVSANIFQTNFPANFQPVSDPALDHMQHIAMLNTGVTATSVGVMPGMGIAGQPATIPTAMAQGMDMPGAALGIPTEVRLVAMDPSPEQRGKMDLNALKEQLQKLVPGAHLTVTSQTPQDTINSVAPTMEGLASEYHQVSLNDAQPHMSIPLAHDGTAVRVTPVMLPQTVRLVTGETVEIFPRQYAAMMPVNLDGTPAATPASFVTTMSPLPQRKEMLSRTPSLKESEGETKSDAGDARQTRIARFQVTKVVEESGRRASDASTCSSPVSSPVRRGRFAVMKVAESTESAGSTPVGTGPAVGQTESQSQENTCGDPQVETPSDPQFLPSSLVSSFVSEDPETTTPATPAAEEDSLSQQPSTNDSSDDRLPTPDGSQFSIEEELDTVKNDFEDLSEDDDSFQQLIYKQEHEEAEMRRRHQQEREAFRVLRKQRTQNRRPQSLRLVNSPGPPTPVTTPASPHYHTEASQGEGIEHPVGTAHGPPISADNSGDASSCALTSGKKGRTISEDMLQLVQNLGTPRPTFRPAGKMTLNQMMALQKSSATVPALGQRPVYHSLGIAAAPFPGQFFSSAYNTFPYTYQRLPDGSVVATSQTEEVSGVPSSTSSSVGNIQQTPTTSATWGNWQQQQ